MTELHLLSSEECLAIAQAQLPLKRRASQELIVKEIQFRQLTKTNGYMGEYYVMLLIIESELPDDLNLFQHFIKTLPQKNLQYRAVLEQKGILRKECGIYKYILPKLREYGGCKFGADCFLARDDILVLEDLHSNYRQPTEVYTMSHYRILLQHVAKLHAASIAWERAEQFSIGERFKDELFEMLLSPKNDWFVTSIKAIILLASKLEQFQQPNAQNFIKQKLYNLLIETEKYAQPSKTLRNVFCHRDLSRGNTFFTYSKDQPLNCCIVDFGLSTYCPPAIDIHFLLYISSTTETRRSIYQEFIDFYFNELQAQFSIMGVPAGEVSRADFQLDCKRAHAAALIMNAISLPQLELRSDLCDELRSKDNAKFEYWMNVDRTELWDIAMANDAVYKAKVVSVIAELVEYLMEYEETCSLI